MENPEVVLKLQSMAFDGQNPSEMLRYLVLELGEQQQLELMLRFTEAFDCSLGEITAIGGWWHDDSAELNDTDVDAYISPLITNWISNKTN